MRWKSESGQAATENLAVVSVLVIAIVAATYTFVPTFSNGVDELATDASEILATGKIGGTGQSRGSNGGPMVAPDGRSPGTTANSETGDAGARTASTDGGSNGGVIFKRPPEPVGPADGSAADELGTAMEPGP